MTEKRASVATLRVIIGGFAADLEATGTVEELAQLPALLRKHGIEPANSPLLWNGSPRPPSRDEQRSNGNGNGSGPPCPVHGRQMLKSKHAPGWYCPEMLDDGSYCKERAS